MLALNNHFVFYRKPNTHSETDPEWNLLSFHMVWEPEHELSNDKFRKSFSLRISLSGVRIFLKIICVRIIKDLIKK
jgi:hypothetical protein